MLREDAPDSGGFRATRGAGPSPRRVFLATAVAVPRWEGAACPFSCPSRVSRLKPVHSELLHLRLYAAFSVRQHTQIHAILGG